MERNINRKSGHGRFFEVGNVHIARGNELPEERKMVGLCFSGETENFFTLKGVLEALFDRLRISGVTWRYIKRSWFQPGRAAEILSADGTVLGEIGDIHPDVTARFGIDQRVYAAELSFDALLRTADTRLRFVPLPRFPVVSRDLAVITDMATEAETLADVIRRASAGLTVENVRLFDTYRGPGILAGKKSLAYSFTLRSDDHTPTDAEIKDSIDTILKALADSGAALRI